MSAMNPDEEKLGVDGRALLEAARGGLEPSAADRTRVRRGVAAALAAGAATATAGATSSAAALTASAVPLALKVAVAFAVLAAAGGGLAYVQRAPGHEGPASRAASAPHARQAPVVAPTRTALARAARPAVPAAPAPIVPSTAVPVAANTPEAPPRPTSRALGLRLPTAPAAEVPAPAPTPIDELPAETALLRRAQAALAAHTATSPDDALAALDEHARRFPAGTLAEERDATRALALCAAGRITEAQSAARSFLAAHPTSPLAHRVRSACPAP